MILQREGLPPHESRLTRGGAYSAPPLLLLLSGFRFDYSRKDDNSRFPFVA